MQTKHKDREERGPEVVIKSFRKTEDQAALLKSILGSLFKDGIEASQIAILSPVRFSSSVVAEITEYSICENKTDEKRQVFFSTIHGFKGLESPVVILTDIDNLTNEMKMNILYVGMTRAKSALFILGHERIIKKLGK